MFSRSWTFISLPSWRLSPRLSRPAFKFFSTRWEVLSKLLGNDEARYALGSFKTLPLFLSCTFVDHPLSLFPILRSTNLMAYQLHAPQGPLFPSVRSLVCQISYIDSNLNEQRLICNHFRSLSARDVMWIIGLQFSEENYCDVEERSLTSKFMFLPSPGQFVCCWGQCEQCWHVLLGMKALCGDTVTIKNYLWIELKFCSS